MPAGRDDLILGLDRPEGGGGEPLRDLLLVAPGGQRARVCTTRRRFGKRSLQTGPRVDRCAELLVGAVVSRLAAVEGERRVRIVFERPEQRGELFLEVELFGPRGLWALTEPDGRIVLLSRLPNQKGRDLRPGQRYQPPAGGAKKPPAETPASPPRFERPIAESVDELFTKLDRTTELRSERDSLIRAADRFATKLEARRQGFAQKLDAASRADEVRAQADALLAYGSQLAPGSKELTAPHPQFPDREIRVPLDPRMAPHQQAERLYKAARKHALGADETRRRIDELDRRIAELATVRLTLDDDRSQLTELRPRLEELGAIDRSGPERVAPAEQKLRKVTQGENFRRFWSREGSLILVGRDNRQNDRLATRVARGNDLWFHVGQGQAGSHVVVRVQKGKSASLETMLDAGTLAIHFSKARGAALHEVIYTQAKHVRKPKGLPAGRVVPSQTRTLRIRHETERLERLLRSDEDGASR